MGLGDYPNFLSPNERHLGSTPVPEGNRIMSETDKDTQAIAATLNRKQEFKLTTGVEIAFDASDVVDNIGLTGALNLVTDLDEEIGEWEFTLLLYHYFKRQHEVALKEVPELAVMGEASLYVKFINEAVAASLMEDGTEAAE